MCWRWSRSLVSIRAPARGATSQGAKFSNALGFDPRSRAGSDQARLVLGPGRDVSIRAPARGATTASPSARSCGRRFDPRSRAGSDAWKHAAHAHADGFDPRSRAGSDARLDARPAGVDVSIRAPARGATFAYGQPAHSLRGFDPRSRAGSDLPLVSFLPSPPGFDPRSRAGSDRSLSPVRDRSAGFDPRSRAGSDNKR